MFKDNEDMTAISFMDRFAAVVVTAFSVVAAVGLLGLDVMWLMDERLPIPARQLFEWQIAPAMACGLMLVGAWSGRIDRRENSRDADIKNT
jgi:hypothetical protein